LTPVGRKLRGSAIEAVVLTDGELDHVTGLLSLREQKELRLVCTRTVRDLLTKRFPLLPTLSHYCRIRHCPFPMRAGKLGISALTVSAKAPPYAKRGEAVGLRIESKGKSLVYLPGLPAITDEVGEFVAGCDCLLVDGTFWSNDEMTCLGLTNRTARDMGHVPISGRDGSLAWLRTLNVPRKIYIHINNTNPILRPGSRERKAVEREGVEIAYDGMDIWL
jgi:pyrroloquinoline quinone biosynthesis protein B